ncbi:MAG: NAD(P)/FAD-dependent oxidoreductase [Bradymonadaceae bacterium]
MEDVLVGGGGPAGLATAIRAAERGLEPVLVEPRTPPIDKACGEGLMPAAVHALRTIGVELSEGYPFRGIRYLDAADATCSATGDFGDRAGRGVRRTDLQRAMWRRARQTGVEVRCDRVRTVTPLDGAVAVDLAEGGTRVARYLVAADGLHSEVCEQVGLEPTDRGARRFGVRRHYARSAWSDRVEVHLADRGEAYVTPIGEGMVGVALLADGGGRFDDLIEGFPVLQRRLADADAVTDDRGAGPFDRRIESPRTGRVLAVGDAAGYLDALTGEGIAIGVETGIAAADCVAAGRPEAYPPRYRRTTRTYWWVTAALLSIVRHRPLHRPLIHVLDVAPGVFDAALELIGGAPEG